VQQSGKYLVQQEVEGAGSGADRARLIPSYRAHFGHGSAARVGDILIQLASPGEFNETAATCSRPDLNNVLGHNCHRCRETSQGAFDGVTSQDIGDSSASLDR